VDTSILSYYFKVLKFYYYYHRSFAPRFPFDYTSWLYLVLYSVSSHRVWPIPEVNEFSFFARTRRASLLSTELLTDCERDGSERYSNYHRPKRSAHTYTIIKYFYILEILPSQASGGDCESRIRICIGMSLDCRHLSLSEFSHYFMIQLLHKNTNHMSQYFFTMVIICASAFNLRPVRISGDV
jgi:hypothetical protein